MKLGIVGHAAEKFTPETEKAARGFIETAILIYRADVVISGRSPMGGVDIWAEEIAALYNIPVDAKVPRQHTWDGEYGFKARNLDIARDSDVVLCVVVADFPPGFKGKRFPFCYHCKDRNPPHIKSGGCWTAWKCKRREWRIIEGADRG